MHCECNVHHKYMTAVVLLLENIKSNSMVSLKFVKTFYVCLRWSKGSFIWNDAHGRMVQFGWAFACIGRYVRTATMHCKCTHTHTYIPPEYLQWIYIIRPYYCSALHYNQASVLKLSTWIHSNAPNPTHRIDEPAFLILILTVRPHTRTVHTKNAQR